MHITKSVEKITPFGGFNFVWTVFMIAGLSAWLIGTLGKRVQTVAPKLRGNSEIMANQLAIFFNGGDCTFNDFGWSKLSCSFPSENTAFMILTAIIANFYRYLVGRYSERIPWLKPTPTGSTPIHRGSSASLPSPPRGFVRVGETFSNSIPIKTTGEDGIGPPAFPSFYPNRWERCIGTLKKQWKFWLCAPFGDRNVAQSAAKPTQLSKAKTKSYPKWTRNFMYHLQIKPLRTLGIK